MLPQSLDYFREIWCVDFEFSAPAGERPDPHCLVAREIHSGQTLRLWRDQFESKPPYPVGATVLFVAYYSSAEFSCHLALGWDLPVYVLDLYTEFRTLTNGGPTPCGRGLVGALAWYGLDSIGAGEKAEMRDLAIRGGPYNDDEQIELLDYCEGDVDALARLVPKMRPALNAPYALLRGRYMKAVASMEHRGVPMNLPLLERLQSRWSDIQARLIDEVDTGYNVFDGPTFKAHRWLAWCEREQIAWPSLASGAPALDKETFKLMGQRFPQVQPMRELRKTLSDLRLNDLTVGQDCRNRCLLSPFGAKTGRNSPSTSKFIFGTSAWLRSLIEPPPGHSLAYIDWEQQEIGIAAVLSGDSAMVDAYQSGDVYLTFAKQSGYVPRDATKKTHPADRALFKMCMLATGYGQGAVGLAAAIARPEVEARQLLQLHHQTYRRFWQWSDAIECHALLVNELHTTFGWRIRVVGDRPNCRSLRNWPVQSNGAEMLRLACSLAVEYGVRICAPVHDAVLIEAPTEEISTAVELMEGCMAEASRVVLSGFELRTDVEYVHYPDRFRDKKGADMWRRVQGLLNHAPGHRCPSN